MRKFERNNILELLATIKESLEYAITVDESAANAVLGDGLDALGAVAEMLEQVLSPDGFSKYSPIMYGLIGAFDLLLTDIDDIKVIDETLDNIFSLFDKLSENMNNEREIKTEVVFFPYKAPMWDSMESIWAAAKQDESCFVTVVPAPYFERDKAGGLSKAYYDGNDFPEYVEVTPADEFDIQAVLPDIAYIHNPYDEHNY
ncbi:MAG: hypothetical protein FWB97_05310, partial [Oscillospiraceae bacterium]|nr:hypothetical protein [Oscillospiraceae bacterium]